MDDSELGRRLPGTPPSGMGYCGKTALYCGDLSPGSTSEMRCRALEQLGFTVTRVPAWPGSPGWIRRKAMAASFKIGFPIDFTSANRTIVELGPAHSIVWIDKGITIRPRTLSAVRRTSPSTLIIGYSPDNMSERSIASEWFRRSLPLYDAYITTKSFGVTELMDLGARQVIYSPSGFDPTTHRPVPSDGCPVFDVGFIGYFEHHRARSCVRLARAGISVSVFGRGWNRLPRPIPDSLSIHGEVLGDSYSQTLCSFRIALCFLRKQSRDLHTTRSVEIPACGVFMLAERTKEHLELFEEGAEAAFFDSDEELVEKVRYYLANEHERSQVAAAGRERVVRSGYAYASQLSAALAKIGFMVDRCSAA